MIAVDEQKVAPKNAIGFARNLMLATMVIAIGGQYAVIPAHDLDSSHTIVKEYDPFA